MRACAMRDEAGAEASFMTRGCDGVVVRREKILLSSVMAWNWASPGCWYGALGCGLAIALARVMAACGVWRGRGDRTAVQEKLYCYVVVFTDKW